MLRGLQCPGSGWPTGNRKKTKQQPSMLPAPPSTCAWLLLIFFPYPVGHPEHEHCNSIWNRLRWPRRCFARPTNPNKTASPWKNAESEVSWQPRKINFMVTDFWFSSSRLVPVSVIDRILLRQELRPNYSAEASAEAASVEMSPKQKHTFSPFWTLLQCYLYNFSTFFDKASARTQKLLQNT